MKSTFTYQVLTRQRSTSGSMLSKVCWTVVLMLFVVTNEGCTKKPSWNKTLKGDDTQPYGTEIFTKSLPKFFPEAFVMPLKPSQPFSGLNLARIPDTNKSELLVIVATQFEFSDVERRILTKFIQQGKDVFIFTNNLDYNTCLTLGIHTDYDLSSVFTSQGEPKQFQLANCPGSVFAGYSSFKPYEVIYNYDSSNTANGYNQNIIDSSQRQVDAEVYGVTHPRQLWAITSFEKLGTRDGKTNFVRVGYNNGNAGNLFFHCSPEVTTNHFLIQDSSFKYLSGLWKYANKKYQVVYLMSKSYYRGFTEHKKNSNTMLPKMFFFLLLATIFYVLTNYRRRQRAIPVVPKLKNESAAFVETVGQLYYNKGNHHNLALKICNQFLEWVRSKYFIPTTEINDEFAMTLHKKSGVELEHAKEITNIIYEVQSGGVEVNESYLQHLYVIVNKFYKNRD